MDNEFWGMEQAYYKTQRKELDDLRKENAELKAKIANGIRVYVEYYEDEEFMDRVAITVLPELIKEWPYRHACEHAYDVAQLLLLEKKERNNA